MMRDYIPMKDRGVKPSEPKESRLSRFREATSRTNVVFKEGSKAITENEKLRTAAKNFSSRSKRIQYARSVERAGRAVGGSKRQPRGNRPEKFGFGGL